MNVNVYAVNIEEKLKVKGAVDCLSTEDLKVLNKYSMMLLTKLTKAMPEVGFIRIERNTFQSNPCILKDLCWIPHS